MSEHLTAVELRDFVSRTLDSSEHDQALTEHLSTCDECFQQYESLWADALSELPDLSEVFLDSGVVGRVEYRLYRRIRVASVATASTWLVTDGFVRAVVGVLLPLVDFERAPTSRAMGEKR